jgi:hypothetical protein
MNDDGMKSRTLTALGDLGEKAKPAIPAIEAYLRRELSDADRQHALFTLERLKSTNSSGTITRQD